MYDEYHKKCVENSEENMHVDIGALRVKVGTNYDFLQKRKEAQWKNSQKFKAK